MNTNEYVKELEKKCGPDKSCGNEALKRVDFLDFSLHHNSQITPKYKWKLKNRLQFAFNTFRQYHFLKSYNPFDIKTYQREYNPYGFDIYTKFYQTSTPWKRLKAFLQEFKNAIKYSFKSFIHTPLVVNYYQNNKKRINWFERNISKLFADKLDSKFKKELTDKGYKIEINKVIYVKK
jgi:hypothetical protein